MMDNELGELTRQLQGLTTTEPSQSTSTGAGSSTGPTAASQGAPTSQGSQGQNESLDEDDMPGFGPRERAIFGTVLGHLKSLQTAVSVPLFDIVHKFDGDSRNFRTWVNEIERYQQIARLSDGDVPQIAHVTCAGPVADYIKRYFQDVKTRHEQVSWEILKILLQRRFGDDTDTHQALAVLRQISQKHGEPVQVYGERFLKVAELAYPDAQAHQETKDFVQRQLVDIFIDGIGPDYLRLKLLREAPHTFERALGLAMKEQNLRRRHNMRADARGNEAWVNTRANEVWVPDPKDNEWAPNWENSSNEFPGYQNNHRQWGFTHHNQEVNQRPVWNSWVQPTPGQTDARLVEPMEIDALRRQICGKCGGQGHRTKVCPTQNTKQEGVRPRGGRRIYVIEETDEGYEGDPRPADKTSPVAREGVTGQNRRGERKSKPSPPQSQQPSQEFDWERGAECFGCHRIGHIIRDCPHRRDWDRNRVPYYPPRNWNRGPRYQEQGNRQGYQEQGNGPRDRQGYQGPRDRQGNKPGYQGQGNRQGN
jgi:hypothetical protein